MEGHTSRVNGEELTTAVPELTGSLVSLRHEPKGRDGL